MVPRKNSPDDSNFSSHVSAETAHESGESDSLTFPFGRNWRSFLSTIDESRIDAARESLFETLGVSTLEGIDFLDVGCGSGLFSLAAASAGANVRSFDYDPDAVQCASILKDRHADQNTHWKISRGSILDRRLVDELGQFDVVYSWGVLHHTGSMWIALENTMEMVRDGGLICIAIYNDQGALSRFWTSVKRLYNKNVLGRMFTLAVFLPLFFVLGIAAGLIRSGNPLARFRNYRDRRGMSIYYDWIDWIGGYPYETARPEEIIDFFRVRGFALTGLRTTNTHGCNEFVFIRQGKDAPNA